MNRTKTDVVNSPFTVELIRRAVQEDTGPPPGLDVTAQLCIPEAIHGRALIVARQRGVLSGSVLLPLVALEYDNALRVKPLCDDGELVNAGQTVAEVSGPMRALLSFERVGLNFLGALSGVATLTRRYVDAIAIVPGSRAEIFDTRKTRPGYRQLEKYAVRCGGGQNHRMGLYDGVMIKDNHIAALRQQLGGRQTLADLTRHVRQRLDARDRPDTWLWLEVDTLDQLAEALDGQGACGANVILLDNMAPEVLRQAVALRDRVRAAGPPLLEASGGITLANVAAVAATGVDRISIGALTHSAPVLDVAMDLQ